MVLWWRLSPRHSTVVRLIAGLLIAGGLAGLLVTPLRERLAGKLDQLEQGDLNAVLSGRLDGWRAALWMARQHALTGVGLGGYGSEFAPAKLALLDQGVRFYDGHVRFSFVNAHNEPLEVVAELGLPGLLAALWAAFVAIRAAAGLARGDRVRGALAWAGLASLLLLGLGQLPFRVAMVAYPNLLLLAWIFSASSATWIEGTAKSGRAGRAGRSWRCWSPRSTCRPGAPGAAVGEPHPAPGGGGEPTRDRARRGAARAVRPQPGPPDQSGGQGSDRRRHSDEPRRPGLLLSGRSRLPSPPPPGRARPRAATRDLPGPGVAPCASPAGRPRRRLRSTRRSRSNPKLIVEGNRILGR